MSHMERCPHCIVPPMAPRIHPLGIGQVFLECPDCGYTEDVQRKPDPKPTPTRRKVLKDGTVVVRQRKDKRRSAA